MLFDGDIILQATLTNLWFNDLNSCFALCPQLKMTPGHGNYSHMRTENSDISN